jgi:imidazolonepropionase-like amidohydrolase
MSKRMFRRIFIFLLCVGSCVLSQNASSLGYEFRKTVVIKNASIYLDYQTRLDSTTMIIASGKIVGIGKNMSVPVGAEVLDYSGKIIYPSFIDVFTDYGVGELRSPTGNKPQYETTVKGAYNVNQAIKPEIEADKYFKHDAARAKQLRELGFGVVATANRDGIIRG